MSLTLRYWLAITAIASFAIGIVASPSVSAAIQPFYSELIPAEKTEELNNVISNEIKKLSQEIDEIKSKPESVQQDVSKEIANLERQLQIIGARIDRLNDLSGDIDKLKKDITTLKTSPQQSQSLSASLNKSEYRRGDSLIVTGSGLSNTEVKVSLLGSNALISEGSTIADSSGKFTFTLQLPSLVDGTYVIKVTQGSSVIEKQFRIISTQTQTQTEGLMVTTDSKEYLRGEKVLISGTTDPDTWIDLDVFDGNDIQLVRTSTKSNANGSYSLTYTIASNAVLGEYEVKVTVGDKQASAKFGVVLTKTSSSSSSSNILTINTDKSTYNRGGFVTVTGKGVANEKVTINVKPSSGDELLLVATADGSGNYRTMFAIKQGASTGQWKLTAKQGTDTATANITVI